MSYAEHGPRIFLAGRPDNDAHSIYGDYVAPQKRSEGRLKMYESCRDIRAWSPNVLENTRYFRELSEHATTIVPGKVVPFDVVMENMIGLTAQAQKELRAAQRELQKYKSLKLTPEQRQHLKRFDKANVERDADRAALGERKAEEASVRPAIKPLLSRETLLFHPGRLTCSRHSPNTYLSMYLYPDQRFRYDKEICSSLLAGMYISKENRFTSSSSTENETYLVSRVTSCDLLNEEKVTRECSNQTSICIEYVDASSQAGQTMREVCVQTDECKDARDVEDDGNGRMRRDVDSCSSQYYGSSESGSASDCRFQLQAAADLDGDSCEDSHKRTIIQKDSEIIVLKNELGMKEDELEELRELNRRLEERHENAKILRRNFNILQKKLQIVSEKHMSEANELSAKLSASGCLVDQLKAELARKCQVCHSQSQEIQQLREQLKDAELLSIENESLARKVEEIECLSKEAESRGVALEQVRSVWRQLDLLQEHCREQSCTLADREDEIQQLLMLIKQMSVSSDSREVEVNEMNDAIADLRNEIRAKDDKISQYKMQLDCIEREVGNLTSMLKSNLNDLDESKVAYESICERIRCEHDTCLDVQSAVATLGTFIAALEEHRRERRDRLQEIDSLKAFMACYSRETVSEIANMDFYTGHELVQSQAIEDVSTWSDRSSKELVHVQVQSDEVETSTTCSDSSRLNQVISNERIDRVLVTHFERHINKMSEILQGAEDQHVQIVREHAKQRQELLKKDHEITELRQRVAEHTLRRGEGDCMMQEQFRKRLLEKERALEMLIGERDSEIARLRQCVDALEERVCAYREERDTLKNENADLIDARGALARENEARREELRAQGDQMRELTQKMDRLKLTIEVLQKEANDIDDLKKKLTDLRTRNDDLTNKLIQANETIREHADIIADLKSRDEKNRLALTRGDMKYDAMLTQKLDDIARLRDENRSLRDQLSEVEIKLTHSNDTILLLRNESDSVAAISALRTSLTGLDEDKEKLLARVDSLRSEIASCEDSTERVASELRELSRQNETLRADLETVRNTNDQLLRARENDAAKRPLKDALCTLPGRIYERIARLREDDGEERGNGAAHGSVKVASSRRGDEATLGAEDDGKERSTKQDEEFDTNQRTRDELGSAAREAAGNSERAAHKLRLLEAQREEREVKTLMNDVQLRDLEIKNLQECVSFLLREKNDLQNEVKRQVEEYQSKLALLKRKYDSSLSAFRKRHNENVERLQARFEDIMKIERSPFDAESWLQSLNLKELAELNNRIDILSSRAAAAAAAAAAAEADIAHVVETSHHASRRSGNPAERKPHNKFTLRKERARQNRTMSLSGGATKRESSGKICDAGSKRKAVVEELYSRDSAYKRKHRHLDEDAEKKPRSGHTELAESGTDQTLDWQREKFIYGCSVHHRLSNGR
ncbi:myosin-14-like [Harpegnathos saltator]|uniref:myosin-14-like n=1 Tax=Harpegnathos saltator TaxID=610380 RepID=UPI000DBEE1DA|nr:myosin-14-like [Harpegnathos saltator]